MEFRGRVGSPSDMNEVELQHMPQDHVDGQMLCREIGAIALAWNLREGDDILRALLLKPKAVHIDVTHLSYPLAIETPLGSRGVELEGNPEVLTHVHAEGLDPEEFTGPSDDSIELRLCRALGYDRLGLRPGFDPMLTNADAASRRTLSGSSAACPISVSPHDEFRLLALHRQPPNEPGMVLEVSATPH